MPQTDRTFGSCEAHLCLSQTDGHNKTKRGQNKMASLEPWLLGVNIAVALGGAVASLLSYARRGFLWKFIRSIDRIEQTEEKVDELCGWKDDAEVVLVTLAIEADEVDEDRVKTQFGDDFSVNELLGEGQHPADMPKDE